MLIVIVNSIFNGLTLLGDDIILGKTRECFKENNRMKMKPLFYP